MQDNDLISLFQIGVSIQNLNKISEKEIGISLVQWCLLKKLVDMPASSALTLAKSVGVHPSTLTQTLKRLEKKKFIFIAEDPQDSRKKMITLTKVGHEALKKANSQMADWKFDLKKISKQLDCIQTTLLNQLEHSII